MDKESEHSEIQQALDEHDREQRKKNAKRLVWTILVMCMFAALCIPLAMIIMTDTQVTVAPSPTPDTRLVVIVTPTPDQIAPEATESPATPTPTMPMNTAQPTPTKTPESTPMPSQPNPVPSSGGSEPSSTPIEPTPVPTPSPTPRPTPSPTPNPITCEEPDNTIFGFENTGSYTTQVFDVTTETVEIVACVYNPVASSGVLTVNICGEENRTATFTFPAGYHTVTRYLHDVSIGEAYIITHTKYLGIAYTVYVIEVVPEATPTPTPSPTPVPTPIPVETPIPTPTPVPEPTPVPTPVPSEELMIVGTVTVTMPTLVASFTGSGADNTLPFTINDSIWELRYLTGIYNAGQFSTLHVLVCESPGMECTEAIWTSVELGVWQTTYVYGRTGTMMFTIEFALPTLIWELEVHHVTN